MITGRCDRTVREPARTETLGSTSEPDSLFRPDAAEPGIVGDRARRLFRPDVAEPSIVRTEPEHLFRPDTAKPGIVGTEPDHLFGADVAEPGIIGASQVPWRP